MFSSVDLCCVIVWLQFISEAEHVYSSHCHAKSGWCCCASSIASKGPTPLVTTDIVRDSAASQGRKAPSRMCRSTWKAP